MAGKSAIKFGTDGWRAIIAEDFTFENVRFCAQAAADYLKESGKADGGMVIGYDTRFASDAFAAASAEVVAANGIKVYLTPAPTPTPVISYGIVALKAGGGIIITASHNPGDWNGLKYKTEDGGSAPEEVIAALERLLSLIPSVDAVKRMPIAEAKQKRLVHVIDLAPVYMEHISHLVDLEALRQSELKVVVDAMYGAGSGYIKRCLQGGRMRVAEIHGEINPLFPGMHPEPIMPNLAQLAASVKRRGAAIGLANDGDADRLGVIDEKGNFITQLQVFALLTLYLLEVRGERGPIVKTFTSGVMPALLGKLYGVPVYETSVGFKYIAPIMLEKDAIIGGEESGGYGFRGHVPERDGVLAALFFLDFMVKTGKSPSQLLDYLYSKVGHHYYQRVDIQIASEAHGSIRERLSGLKPEAIDGTRVAGINTQDGFHFLLADGSWLLIRFSGTEPLIRIYAESDSLERVGRMLKIGQGYLGLSK